MFAGVARLCNEDDAYNRARGRTVLLSIAASKISMRCKGTKLGNVQVALDALRAVDGVDQIVGDLKAEDIVDGHRERTMTLLWALSGPAGFKTLQIPM